MDLKGWTYSRKDAMGVLSDVDRIATATIKDLEKGQRYDLRIYMYSATHTNDAVLRVQYVYNIVSHQQVADRPAFRDKSVLANENGEIVLEFHRIKPGGDQDSHVHFSGVAIVPVKCASECGWKRTSEMFERLLPDNACEGGDCKILGSTESDKTTEIVFLYRSTGMSKISVRFSRVHNQDENHAYSRIGLDSEMGWYSGNNKRGDWVEYDLGELRYVTGITMQGKYNQNEGIKSYEIEVSRGEGKPYVYFEIFSLPHSSRRVLLSLKFYSFFKRIT